MINWFDMPAEGLSNGGLFEVKELEVTENGTYETKGEMYNKVTVNVPSPTGKITITENGTGINVAQYATADVNVEGGGGSSDFSTAEVIINVIGGDNFRRVTFDGLVSIVEEHGQTAMTANPILNGLNTVNCVLYNGYAGATIIAPPGFTITDTSADGDVSIEDNLYVDITGDGSLTVTISNE